MYVMFSECNSCLHTSVWTTGD